MIVILAIAKPHFDFHLLRFFSKLQKAMLEAILLQRLSHDSIWLLGHWYVLVFWCHGHRSLLCFQVLLDGRCHRLGLVAHRVLRPLPESHFSANDGCWLPLGIFRFNLALVSIKRSWLSDLLVDLCIESHVQQLTLCCGLRSRRCRIFQMLIVLASL